MPKYLKTKPGSIEEAVVKAVLSEKLKVSDGLGAWITDFQDSDAPQFSGKSKEERQKMAIAAFVSAGGKLEQKDEELTAKQKKIDLDKDGEIDADDLKKLRAQGAKKEEYSIIESAVNYISSMWQEAAGVKVDKKEEKEDNVQVKGKTMTGKPLDKIEVNPKDKSDK